MLVKNIYKESLLVILYSLTCLVSENISAKTTDIRLGMMQTLAQEKSVEGVKSLLDIYGIVYMEEDFEELSIPFLGTIYEVLSFFPLAPSLTLAYGIFLKGWHPDLFAAELKRDLSFSSSEYFIRRLSFIVWIGCVLEFLRIGWSYLQIHDLYKAYQKWDKELGPHLDFKGIEALALADDSGRVESILKEYGVLSESDFLSQDLSVTSLLSLLRRIFIRPPALIALTQGMYLKTWNPSAFGSKINRQEKISFASFCLNGIARVFLMGCTFKILNEGKNFFLERNREPYQTNLKNEEF